MQKEKTIQKSLRKKSKAKISTLKRKATETFNLFIRLRDVTELKGKCFTCGERGSHAGHFIHGRNSVRYDESNVHLQCVKCNTYNSGSQTEYTLKMIDKYGEDYVRALVKKSKKTHPFATKELEEIIEIYTDKVNNM